MNVLKDYLKRTHIIRGDENQLFISHLVRNKWLEQIVREHVRKLKKLEYLEVEVKHPHLSPPPLLSSTASLLHRLR